MALLVSLRTVSIAVMVSFILSIFLAWISTGRSKPLSRLIEFLVMIPAFIPPTVLGFYLLRIMGNNSFPGKIYRFFFGASFIFSPTAAITAAALAGLPFIFKSIKSFLESVDKEIIASAETEGASEFQIFFYIMLPLARQGVLSGVLLAFLRGLGEFGITLMVAGNIQGVTRTLSLAIWDSIVSGKTEAAYFYSILLGVVSIIVIVSVKLLGNKYGE